MHTRFAFMYTSSHVYDSYADISVCVKYMGRIRVGVGAIQNLSRVSSSVSGDHYRRVLLHDPHLVLAGLKCYQVI